MRTIDMSTWPRRKHFEFFQAMNHPQVGLCANVDITALRAATKERQVSISIAVTYVLARTANAIPEFRLRIRGAQVVEHDVVHPSFTVMATDDLFSFCTMIYDADFARFAEAGAAAVARAQANPNLENEPGQDDLLYMSVIPWVSFTAFLHPMQMHPVDSMPRIAWGKFFAENDRLKMPLAVQGHHAVMDGVHVGRYYEQVQGLLDRPAEWMSNP